MVYTETMHDTITELRQKIKAMYEPLNMELQFHGWHHINFVTRKALEFAPELGADPELVEISGLVHDLNYIVDRKSDADAGKELRTQILTDAGFSPEVIKRVESIVMEGSTSSGIPVQTPEAKALADGDRLFKVLPIGPVIFSSRYIAETGVDLQKWSSRIIDEQIPLLENDEYFYSQTARQKYLPWAKQNLDLVKAIHNSLDDPDMQALIENCREIGILQ